MAVKNQKSLINMDNVMAAAKQPQTQTVEQPKTATGQKSAISMDRVMAAAQKPQTTQPTSVLPVAAEPVMDASGSWVDSNSYTLGVAPAQDFVSQVKPVSELAKLKQQTAEQPKLDGTETPEWLQPLEDAWNNTRLAGFLESTRAKGEARLKSLPYAVENLLAQIDAAGAQKVEEYNQQIANGTAKDALLNRPTLLDYVGNWSHQKAQEEAAQPGAKEYQDMQDKWRQNENARLQQVQEAGMKQATKGMPEWGKTATQLASGILDSASQAALGSMTGVDPNIIYAAGALAESTAEAEAAGASKKDQAVYGALQSGLTYATGKLFAAVPETGDGAIGALAKKSPKLANVITNVTNRIAKNPYGKQILDNVFDSLGEGLEEVIQEAATPYMQRLTYDPDADAATVEDLTTAFLLGTLSSMAYNAPSTVSNAINAFATRDKSAKSGKTADTALVDEAKKAAGVQNATTLPDNVTTEADNVTTEVKNINNSVDNATVADNATVDTEEVVANKLKNVQIQSKSIDTSILSDLPKARKSFIKYAQMFFPAQVTISSNGKKVDITRRGLDKLLSGNIKTEKYISAFNTPQLIENAVKTGQATNKKEETQSGVLGYEYYDSSFTIDDKPYTAHIRVRNTTNGDKYYGHTVSEVDNIEIEPKTRTRTTDVALQPVNNVPGSDASISQENDAVNDSARDYTANNGQVSAYLAAAINDESKALGKALGVPYSRRGDFAKGRLRELANAYMATGKLDADLALSIFDEAWEQGKVINQDMYNSYQDLKRELQNTKLQITDEVKNNIPDWDNWRKMNRYKVGMTETGGVPIDQKYEELSAEYPNLFPESITDLASQLEKMADVSAELYKSERSLTEIYGDQTGGNYKAMRKAFAERIAEFEKKLEQAHTVQTEQDGKKVKPTAPESVEAVKATYKTAKDARKEYDKILARSGVLLTDEQKRQVQALAAGKLSANEIPDTAAKASILQLAEIRKRELDALAPLKAYKQSYREGLRSRAAELIEGSYAWKTKDAGWMYSRETMERNIRDMVKDKTKANKIIGEYFTPVHKSEAARTRFKNELRNRVRRMNLTDVESEAVQYLGEVNAQLEDWETRGFKDIADKRDYEALKAERDNFVLTHDFDRTKVYHAIDEFREIYNDLFEQMNEVRIRNGYEPVDYRKNYFPHFLEDRPDSLVAKLGAALGIELKVSELPVDIAGRTHTFRPGIQWFGNALQRTTDETVYDAVRGFDTYLEGISNVIYHTDNIQKLRALSNEMRYQGTEPEIRKQIDKIRADENISDYERDARIKEIYDNQRTRMSEFVQELEEYTNILAGKKSILDRNMEKQIGRKMYDFAKALNNRVAANMVAVNPGSWITNFAPLVQMASQTNPVTMANAIKDTVHSYVKNDGFVDESTFLTNRRGSNPLVVDNIEKLSNALTAPMQWIDNFTSDTVVRARYYDNVKRGMSHQDALDEADSYAAGLIADRSKGALPTIFEAKNPVVKLFTTYQVEVNNQLSWMFKDIPRDERNKSVAMVAWKLLSLFVSSYLANDLYEKLRGNKVLFDPARMVNEAVGDVTGYQLPNVLDVITNATKGKSALPFNELSKTEQTGIPSAISGAAQTAAAEIPFVGNVLGGGRIPISAALPDATKAFKIFDPEVDTKKKIVIGAQEILGKPLTYLALPLGGGQIKKTYEGILTMAAKGSYTRDNEGEKKLQYPVDVGNGARDILPWAQAAVFGKSSLPQAKTWVDSGFKTKSVAFTDAYEYLIDEGVKTMDAYNLVNTLKSIESTDEESSTKLGRDMLMANNMLTDKQKSQLDQILYGKTWEDKRDDVQKSMVNAKLGDEYTEEDKRKATATVSAALDRIGAITGKTDEETIKLRRAALAKENTLSDEQKQMVRYRLLDGPVSYASEAEHRRSLDDAERKAKIDDFVDFGGTIESFYEVYDKFAKIKPTDEEKGTSQKRAWLLANDTLTPKQKTKLDQLLINKDKTVDYTSEAAHRTSLATDSQKTEIAGYKKIGGTAEEYWRVYDAFKAAEGDSDLSTAKKKKNVYNALPYKYQQIVDKTPKDENLNALKSYLLQSMTDLSSKEKQYLDEALIGKDIMPMERNVTYGDDSSYALAALGESYESKYNKQAAPAGIDKALFVKAHQAYSSATWEKGKDGAKSKAIKASIDAVTSGLTKSQKQVLYEIFGVGKSYW